MHFLCILILPPLIEYVYQLLGYINIIVAAPFVTVIMLYCIGIVHCKADCGNKLIFCSVLFKG